MRFFHFIFSITLSIIALPEDWSCNPATSTNEDKTQDTTEFICFYPGFEEEIPPIFPGGVNAWQKYLSDSAFYPEVAYEHKTEGTARIQLTISEDGSVIKVTPLSELKDSLIEEAVRVIRASPKWTPARRNGKPISYRMVQCVTFLWQPEEEEESESKCKDIKSNIPIS